MKEDKKQNKLLELVSMLGMLEKLGINLQGAGGGQTQLAQIAPLLGLANNIEDQNLRRDESADRKLTSEAERQNLQTRTQATQADMELAAQRFAAEEESRALSDQLASTQLEQLRAMMGLGRSQAEADLMARNVDNAINLQQLAGALAYRNPDMPGVDAMQLGQLTGLPLAQLIQQQPQQLDPEKEAFKQWLATQTANR